MIRKDYCSKSDFQNFRRCPHLFWNSFYHPECAGIQTRSSQLLLRLGHEIEKYAFSLFEGGIQLSNGPASIEFKVTETINAISNNHYDTFFESTFKANGLLCRTDVIKRSGDQSFDIYEIKMGTEVKDDHLYDLAFQNRCINQAGYSINKSKLILIDNTYIRSGDIDSKLLFKTIDCSKEIEDVTAIVIKLIDVMHDCLCNKFEPEFLIGSHCKYPAKCPYYAYCHNSIPEFSIHELCRGYSKIPKLIDMGISLLKEIPDDFPLTPGQTLQVKSAKREVPIVDYHALRTWLDKLTYPLFFFDFETLAANPLPFFSNSTPYEPIPFQFSIHKNEFTAIDCIHYEFLVQHTNDPRIEIIENLINALGNSGSIVCWNMSFEKRILVNLTERFPQYTIELLNIVNRIVDLMEPFKSGAYVDYRFYGSSSLKAVVPILTPEYSYNHLEIQRGDDASSIYQEYLLGYIDECEWEMLRTPLLKYCKNDTLVMVNILNRLLKLFKNSSNPKQEFAMFCGEIANAE